jgi:1-acyl-sn-glycerol-3-phosphate acyltransferase
VNPFYRTIRTIFRPILRLYNGLEVRGAEGFPMEGPALVVANHHSYLDAFVLGAAAPRKLHFMVKRSQFRKWFARWFYWGMEAFPVNQEGTDKEAIRRALQLLDGGRIVAVYPSGERVLEPGPGEWLPGFSLLARRSGAPVVPAAIRGSYEAFPRGAVWPRPGKVVVLFGEAERYSEEQGREAFVERMRQRVGEMLEGSP